MTKLRSTAFDWPVSTYTPGLLPTLPFEPLHLLLSPEYSPLSIIACYTISQTSNHRRTLLSCYPINLAEKHATAVQRVISHHATMSSRNRQPRASLNQDADEERRLWSMIREGAKKIDSMVVSCRFLFPHYCCIRFLAFPFFSLLFSVLCKPLHKRKEGNCMSV